MEGVKIAENVTEISFWNKWYDWSLSGVDFNYEGNGGIECRDHVSFNRRVNETLLGMGVPSLAYILYLIYSTFATTSRPQKQTYLVSCTPRKKLSRVSSVLFEWFSNMPNSFRC